MRHIFWAGDSTVATNKASTYPQTGIGQAFDRFTAMDVCVCNRAVNGRSTKSFIDESRLAPIYDEITKGDFLFIQFGHNDEKKNDPSRYTDPHGEFIVNLGKYVNVARNKGAYPVFITSVERRLFDENGNLRDMTFSQARDMIEMEKLVRRPDYYLDMIHMSIDTLRQKYDRATAAKDVIFYGYLYQEKKCFGLDYNDLIKFSLYIFRTRPSTPGAARTSAF